MKMLACQQMEVDARRSTFADTGVRLLLHGVEWQIPSRGVCVRPVFGEDGAVAVDYGVDDWPDADAIIREADVDDTAAVVNAGPDTLGLLFGLAAKLLGVHYELTGDQLTAILTLTQPQPIWLRQLLCWCHGRSMGDAEPKYTQAEVDAMLTISTGVEIVDDVEAG